MLSTSLLGGLYLSEILEGTALANDIYALAKCRLLAEAVEKLF